MQSLTANLMAVHYPLATFTLLLLPFTVEFSARSASIYCDGAGSGELQWI